MKLSKALQNEISAFITQCVCCDMAPWQRGTYGDVYMETLNELYTGNINRLHSGMVNYVNECIYEDIETPQHILIAAYMLEYYMHIQDSATLNRYMVMFHFPDETKTYNMPVYSSSSNNALQAFKSITRHSIDSFAILQ